MLYWMYTLDPLPISKKLLKDKEEVYNWYEYLKTLLPYEIKNPQSGVTLINTTLEGEDLFKFKYIYESSEIINLPLSYQDRINNLITRYENLKMKDSLEKETFEKKISVLREYLKKDIRKVNFKLLEVFLRQ